MKLVIVGGGEHARVVAEAAYAAGWQPIGYTEADQRSSRVPGLACLGTDAEFASILSDQPTDERPTLVLGFGGPPDARRRAVDAFGTDARWAVVIHPGTWVSPTVEVGPGSVVLAGSIINAGAVLGPHSIINSGAIVEHDARIGAHAHVASGATIGGGARLGEDVFVGLGASVRDHVTVGGRAVVGMGAVVIRDVLAGTSVIGVPARAVGKVAAPGAKARDSAR